MRQGFTLLELSIVLALIGVLIGGGLVILTASVQSTQFNATVARMDAIEKALLDYSVANNRIPCPSDLTIKQAAANYGVEAATPGACYGGTPSANFKAASGTVEGGIPTRALRLTDDYLYDGWGHRLRYAVDPTYTASNSLPVKACCSLTSAPDATAITVNDASGNPRTTNAVYAIVSHGANGHGAYTSNGTVMSAGSVNADEQTNCHCNASGAATAYAPTYVEKYPTLDASNALDNFDDIVTFKDAWQLQTANSPLTMASCNISKYVYVTDQTNCTLQKFDTSGTFIWKIGSCGGSNGFCSGGPGGVAQDSSGNLWVVDTSCNRVIEFNSSGTYLGKFGSYGTGGGQFSGDASAISINSSGTILVSDYGGSGGPCRIEEFSSSGSYLTQFSSIGGGNGQCQYVTSIAFDPSGNIWISDYYNYRMEEFNASGSYLGQIDNNVESWGMAVDASGNLWETLNDGSNAVKKYNTGGTLLQSIGGTGSGNGKFNGPDVIAVDSSGNLWITDDLNYRVQEFNSSGSFLQKFGSQGTGNGQFEGPNYIYIGSQ